MKCQVKVALRKESVDRNLSRLLKKNRPSVSLSARRAWIEILVPARQVRLIWSLSARRAWIEIHFMPRIGTLRSVALRKESVDRNTSIDNLTQGVFKSLSARRAWIEMRCLRCCAISCIVALRKESVDRNKLLTERLCNALSRSPQGERG